MGLTGVANAEGEPVSPTKAVLASSTPPVLMESTS